MSVQVIEKNGTPEWAVLPYKEYIYLMEETQTLQDIRAYDKAIQAVEDGEELIPSKVMYAILDGENPIRIWRKYKKLTQQELSTSAGISKAYLSQIESGKRKGSTKTLSAIANSLELTLDDIV